MTIVKKSRVTAYSCEEMYNLVNDVERYAEFLPYCEQSLVHYRNDDEVQATLVLAAGGMNKSFTTRNLLQRNKIIEIRLVDGPFSHLEGFWRFDEVEGGSLVSLDMEFDFAGRMLSLLVGPFFEQISSKMVDTFCDRAAALYGPR